MKPEVSVIIVSWNVREIINDCIRSVISQSSCTLEVIVIDNDSSDGSADLIEQLHPEVKLIRNSKNVGFATANNQGLEIAKGKYILLLNPDTIVWDHAIDKMLGWAGTKQNLGCAGCQVYQSNTDIQHTSFKDPSPYILFLIATGLHRFWRIWKPLGLPEYSWWDRKTEKNVDVVSGMFMLVPKKIVDEIGLMDTAYFVYSEEADWCRRIRKAGYACVFTPIAKILHRDGGNKSTYQIRTKMYVQLQKSQLIYTRKYYGLLGFLLVKAMYVAIMAARLSWFGARYLVGRDGQAKQKSKLAFAAMKYHSFGSFPN